MPARLNKRFFSLYSCVAQLLRGEDVPEVIGYGHGYNHGIDDSSAKLFSSSIFSWAHIHNHYNEHVFPPEFSYHHGYQFRAAIDPIFSIGTLLSKHFKAYHSFNAFIEDCAHPILGLLNLLDGVLHLAIGLTLCIVFFVTYPLLLILALSTSLHPSRPFIMLVCATTWAVHGLANTLYGSLQIALAPINYLLGIWLRLCITAFQSPKKDIKIENSSTVKTCMTLLKAIPAKLKELVNDLKERDNLIQKHDHFTKTFHQKKRDNIQRKAKEQNLPESFFCYITEDVMDNPVTASDGHNYDRTALMCWFSRGRRTSPITGKRMPTEFTKNNALEANIAKKRKSSKTNTDQKRDKANQIHWSRMFPRADTMVKNKKCVYDTMAIMTCLHKHYLASREEGMPTTINSEAESQHYQECLGSYKTAVPEKQCIKRMSAVNTGHVHAFLQTRTYNTQPEACQTFFEKSRKYLGLFSQDFWSEMEPHAFQYTVQPNGGLDEEIDASQWLSMVSQYRP